MKKKLISLVIVGAMVFSLTACGGGSSDNKEDTSSDTTAEETQEVEAPEESDEDTANEDGEYEKVDAINIDSGDTKLEYERAERTTLEGGEELMLLYFNFTNVSVDETSVDAEYDFTAYQDGVEIDVYSMIWDEIEAAQNRDKSILAGASLEIAIAVAPSNWDSPITLRVDDATGTDFDADGRTYQEQEISLQ